MSLPHQRASIKVKENGRGPLFPCFSLSSANSVNAQEKGVEDIINLYRPGNNRNFGTGHDVQELFISPGHFWVNIAPLYPQGPAAPTKHNFGENSFDLNNRNDQI